VVFSETRILGWIGFPVVDFGIQALAILIFVTYTKRHISMRERFQYSKHICRKASNQNGWRKLKHTRDDEGDSKRIERRPGY